MTRQLKAPHCSETNLFVTVWVGGDGDQFLEQSMILAENWGAKMIVRQGEHHFDVIGSLKDPNSILVTLTTCLS